MLGQPKKARCMTPSEEDRVRRAVQSWHLAWTVYDIGTMLNLMADDAVLLFPGQAPVTKDNVANISPPTTAPETWPEAPMVEVQEIKLAGDWAFLWDQLTTRRIVNDAQPPKKWSGHRLFILNRVEDEWLISRVGYMMGWTRDVGGQDSVV